MKQPIKDSPRQNNSPPGIHEQSGAELHFRHFAETLPQIVWTAEPDGVLDYIGPQMGKYTGVSEDDPDYLNWAPLIHPEDLDEVMSNWGNCVQKGTIYEQEVRIRSANGNYEWFTARAVPIHNEAKQVIKWYGTTTNVDSLKKSAAEKDRFIAMLGHELRNPLSAITNSYHALGNDLNQEKRELTMEILGRQISHLSRLVNDTLDVSRLSAGNFKLVKGRLSLNRIVQDCVKDYEAIAREENIRLELDETTAALWTEGDSVRISQCLNNLLSNGIKFTDAGGQVSVSLREEPEAGMAVIEVRDTGIGLTPEEMEFIFEPFRQGASAYRLSKDGLGLGLSVIREIMVLHEGEASVRSEGKGRGATFSLRFKTTEGPAVGLVDTGRGDKKPNAATILIIEDDVNVSTALELLLQSSGHEVHALPDGRSAFSFLAQEIPDIIFCDLSLSGSLEGWDIARQIRATYPDRAPYLVALSGHAQPSHVAASMEAGFDEHLAKPATLEQLRQAVAKALK
ncbi:MAG: ATP-binding protein [Verrucomicrobiota bacterium JB023]|nr:ATP-binding protein [Verrucomicrobiota bacterium JB023]